MPSKPSTKKTSSAHSIAIDQYIDKAADFARPILNSLRELVHETCPDVREDIKWRMPFFVYRDTPLCHMGAFKSHCVFGLWKASVLEEQGIMMSVGAKEAMGQFGRLTSLQDLPSKKHLAELIRHAMALNESDVPIKRVRRAATDIPEIPADVLVLFKKNAVARKSFDALPPSHKREHLNWILDAKKAETRERRIMKTMEKLSS